MKVEILNKETIKPSSPTPPHLQTHTISVLDQIAFSVYTPLVLFYPRPNAKNAGHGCDRFSQTIKTSLSDTLTLFPPLAGRLKDNVSVECNDDGVQCCETRVHSTLDQFLSHSDVMKRLRRLINVDDGVNVHTEGQLFVQINMFSCGGIALGVSFSHKLCDAATFATFLKSWSARAINSDQVIVPDLNVSATTLPPRKDITIIRPLPDTPPTNDDNGLTTTRLVFDGKKINALKEKSASPSTPQPTRVEAVTALIGKCAMAASTKTKIAPACIFTHIVNLRQRFKPSLPETTFGNLVGFFKAFSEHNADIDMSILVDKFRKAKMEYYNSLAANGPKMSYDTYVSEMLAREPTHENAVEMIAFSSWCGFGLYEADFGIGKPMWVGYPALRPLKNMTVLMDTRDGQGIEAYINLTKQDMVVFQSDPLLLHYASVNLSVLLN